MVYLNPKVCRMMALFAVFRGFGLSFYLLWRFRGAGIRVSGLGFRV